MISDDPFAQSSMDDRTVIRPIPGGRRTDIPSPSPQPSRPFSSEPIPKLGNLNPLENAASGLLALITRLNNPYFQTDPMGLKNKLLKEIEQFSASAQNAQIDLPTISSTSYVLCTVLDEAVINTPWGHKSGWTQHSLLSILHNEVSGGERFFDLLKSLAQTPTKNRYLLELMYICLALGFEGRYRLVEGGKNKLASIREWLYQILQKERGALEPALSPHWQGVTDRRNPLMKLVPLWAFGAMAAALLAIIFMALLFKLNNDSDPVFQALSSISAPQSTTVEIEPPPPATPHQPEVTLSILLANEIGLKQLYVTEQRHKSTVTIQSDSLFSSGSSSINPAITPLLERISDALNRLPGRIVITGHSDNQPIRSIRYPSNWHLSKARAEAVADIIKQTLNAPERIDIIGKSDLEPVTSNATPEGRAKNRRVDVMLVR